MKIKRSFYPPSMKIILMIPEMQLIIQIKAIRNSSSVMDTPCGDTFRTCLSMREYNKIFIRICSLEIPQ